MTIEDWNAIYSEMISLIKKDKELTHIDISFHIKPIKSDKKIALISIKTFKDKKYGK